MVLKCSPNFIIFDSQDNVEAVQYCNPFLGADHTESTLGLFPDSSFSPARIPPLTTLTRIPEHHRILQHGYFDSTKEVIDGSWPGIA